MFRHSSCLTLLALALLSGCGDDAPKGDPPVGDPPVKDPVTGATVNPVPASRAGPRFEEVAEKVGVKFHMTFLEPEQGLNFKINLYDHGSGIAIDDIDGDGDDDLYMLNQLGKNRLFRNKGDGTFDDITDSANVGLGNVISVAAAFADCDNDGDADLYVTTTRGGNVYFENDGTGKFSDKTREAGLKMVVESMSPTFFDADSDGDLDLLVTNTAHWTTETFDEGLRYYKGPGSLWDLVGAEKAYNVMYLNDGKGKFTKATDAAGIAGRGWGGDAAVFDFDEDGDLDVYVCNMFGANLLFQNDGKGRFTDVAGAVLGKTSWGAVGAKSFDFDGDAHMDLYVVDMHSDMWGHPDLRAEMFEPQKKYASFMERQIELGSATKADEEQFDRSVSIEREKVLFGNTLFRNKGDGTFEEVSDKSGAETWWPWGIASADFDSDGHMDAFLPTGMGHPYVYWRSPLLHNDGKGKFVDVAREAGLDPLPGGVHLDLEYRGKPVPKSLRSAAVADFDGDGKVDLIVNSFNDRAYLFRNTSPDQHWCSIRLKATRGHHEAIGALVKVTAGGRTQVRQVHAAGGYLAQSSKCLHFGLGAADTIERVEILWPGGHVQVLETLPIDQLSVLTEPAE